MRVKIALAVIVGAFALAATSASADAAWYWSEGEAEDALVTDYDGIYRAYCYGRGRWLRTESGLKGFRHFRCYTDMVDGSEDTGRFHVRGKWRYSFYWG